MATTYFYMRISTAEEKGLQRYTRQEKALERYAQENKLEYDNHNIYKEDRSGKNFTDRKEWQKLENKLHEGDTIVFKDICRFTRETKNGLEKYMHLMNDLKVNLIFLDNPTLSTDYIKALSNAKDAEDNVLSLTIDFIVKLILTVELDRAQKERETLSQRIKDGIPRDPVTGKATKQGRKPGTLEKMTDELRQDIQVYLKDRSVRQVDLMSKYNLSRNTLKKYIKVVQAEGEKVV